MDSWAQDHQRHKRTYDEMSQHQTLSPSPFFGLPHLSLPHLPPPVDQQGLILQRRRTSHPHNLPQPLHVSPDGMAELPRPRHRPSLEHRASQTIIDLTEDTDVVDLGRQPRRSPPRPVPRLERSDLANLEDIIDLTDDVEEENDLEITHARSIASGTPHLPRRHHTHRQRQGGRLPAIRLQRDHSPLFVPEQGGRAAQYLGFAGHVPGWQDLELAAVIFGHHNNQQMPHVLNYEHHAFAPRPPPAKPEHQPPAKATEGFTRSPLEEDIIICPACEEELVSQPDGTVEPAAAPKKVSSRPPSKKDREEHPFWAVRACGHVYCNKCYQTRKPDKKSTSANFRQTKSSAKGKVVPMCSVEGCESEVGDRKYWVGIFLS